MACANATHRLLHSSIRLAFWFENRIKSATIWVYFYFEIVSIIKCAAHASGCWASLASTFLSSVLLASDCIWNVAIQCGQSWTYSRETMLWPNTRINAPVTFKCAFLFSCALSFARGHLGFAAWAQICCMVKFDSSVYKLQLSPLLAMCHLHLRGYSSISASFCLL